MKSSIRTSLQLACLALGASLASGAYAQGFYLGGGIGQGHASIPGASGTGITVNSGTTNDTSYTLYGGYQFTPHWGLEVGYDDLGNKDSANAVVSGTPGTVSGRIDNWYVAGTGTLPLGGGFSLLGKLGVVRNSIHFGNLCGGALCVPSGSSTRTQPLVGVGAQYDFDRNWAARLEYDDYGKVSGDNYWGAGGGTIKANAWNLSVKYAF